MSMFNEAERRFRIAQRRQQEDARANLPAYPRDGRSPLLEQRLNDKHDELLTAAESLDRVLEEVADEFAEAFARDDARAAVRDRIAAASPSAREQAKRVTRRG